MRPLRASVRALAAAFALALASIGTALEPDDGVDGYLATALRETVRAARGLALDDRFTALDALGDATFSAVQARNATTASLDPSLTDRVRARLLRRIETFQLRLGEATDAVEDGTLSAKAAARSLQKAAAAGAKARKLMPDPLLQAFDAVPAGNGFAKAGRRVTVRLLPGAGGLPPGVPAATVANDGPGVAFEAAVEVLTPSKLRLLAGPDGGGATLTIDLGGDTRTLRLCNLGPRGALGKTPPWGDAGAAPTTLTYPETAVQWRVGEAITPLPPTVTGGHPPEFIFTAFPGLPEGVVLDPATGVISGTPTAEQALTEHGIRATNLHGFAGAL
ncbi:MAG TPA: putative Ig domain-containing protein, partial [Planctomycetota bacterium]|nr:putative Ig domain-containing protein [Planctomycetota bacterium]